MSVIDALAPAFAVGFAIQQLLELLDPIAGKAVHGSAKKIALGLVALAVGVIAAAYVDAIRILAALGVVTDAWIDVTITGLVVSAGTEGLNSIVKFLGYAKENKKEDAKAKGSEVAKA